MATTDLLHRSNGMRPDLLHFLLLPLPGQGHVNPMLALAENLVAAEGRCIVTIVLPEYAHRALLESSCTADQDQLIRFAILPDDTQPHSLEDILTAMQQQQGFLESLIHSSRSATTATSEHISSCPPISCLVSDFMLPWTQDVANNCGIPRALFWPCSAAFFHIGSVAKAGGIYPGAPQLHALQQKLHISARAMLEVFHEDRDKLLLGLIYEGVAASSHVLMNDFEALDGHLLPLLPPNTRFIGPCLPPSVTITTTPAISDHTAGDQYDDARRATSRFGSMTKENMACLSWLDEQEDSSVLFISFGSFATVPPAQLAEMALGLEASKHKFLWVARAGSSTASFPEGFLHRTKERGMVIPWAPQLQVLKHRAVGGFLTHCGWNSTMESIYMGVPMICFPISGDQPINEETILFMNGDVAASASGGGGLGLGFEGRRKVENALQKSSYVVSRDEVESTVRALMLGGHGVGDGDGKVQLQMIRENACYLMGRARGSLHHDSGSSHAALLSFIQDIRHLASINPTVQGH